MPLRIVEARAGEELKAVCGLCRQFRAGQLERYADHADLIAGYYDAEGFERTLERLADIHAPPCGLILLARIGGAAAGCVMYAPDGATTCQMKRMFVAPAYRRAGVARALANALIDAARRNGYTRMRLDTGPRQTEAVALYRQLGFEPCPPYDEDGPQWPGKVYMAMPLEQR